MNAAARQSAVCGGALRSRVALAVVLWALGAMLPSCAVQSMKSSGAVATRARLQATRVAYDPIVPSQIRITRVAKGAKPVITPADEATAVANVSALNVLFSRGFKEHFPGAAAKYGLQVDNARRSLPLLRISVASMQMRCTDFGCQSSFTLSGTLTEAQGAAPWSFSSKVGQAMVNATISDEIFESFEKALLDAMRSDGLIAAP
jgi:hypothetical protein